MTRRIYTYTPETGWGDLNMLATIGAYILALGILLFIINVFQSRSNGLIAGDNPWQADSLEWGTQSPPKHYNFVFPPIVNSRDPLWTLPEQPPVVTGLDNTKREVALTRFLDAEPYARYILPGPTIWPFLFACTGTYALAGSVFNMWHFVYGAALSFIPLIGWFWPRHEKDLLTEDEAEVPR